MPIMQLKSLTSLRFFAALFVVLSHLSFLSKSELPATRWIYEAAFYEGYIGVTFFFMLSGFILAHSYGRKITSGHLSYYEFMASRIARIAPLHLLTLLLALPLILLIPGSIWLSRFIGTTTLNAVLLHAFVPSSDVYFSLNAPSWSISAEMFFYALFPFLLCMRTRTLLPLAVTILFIQQIAAHYLPKEMVHFFIYIFPPIRIADFIIGILLYRAYQANRHVTDSMATGLQTVAMVLLVAFIAGKSYISQAARFDAYYVVPMAFVILSFAWQNGKLARAISHRALVFLGEASFALYLVHNLVIQYGEKYLRTANGVLALLNVEQAALLYVSLSITVGIMLFRWFETRSKLFTLRLLSASRKSDSAWFASVKR
jgi:peptidoglycan/LPS O-acetylase OafA/YrhL